jgi:hypothetical protein
MADDNRYGLADPCCGYEMWCCDPDTIQAEMKVIFSGVKAFEGSEPCSECGEWNRPEGFIVSLLSGSYGWGYGKGPCNTGVGVGAQCTELEKPPGSGVFECGHWWTVLVDAGGAFQRTILYQEVTSHCIRNCLNGAGPMGNFSGPPFLCDFRNATCTLSMEVP